MEVKPTKLPELSVLKELLENDLNIVWYSRQASFEGSEESLKYVKEKIKEFKLKKEEKESLEKLPRPDKNTIL